MWLIYVCALFEPILTIIEMERRKNHDECDRCFYFVSSQKDSLNDSEASFIIFHFGKFIA